MSSFNTLPDLVIKNILFYASLEYGILEDPIDQPLAIWKRLCPLLWLCVGWRSFVLEILMKGYEIKVSETDIQHGMRLWPQNLDLPVLSAVPWIKDLHITLDFPMVGIAADQFPIVKVSLSSVQSVIVYVHHHPGRLEGVSAAHENTTRFIQYLQELAQNVENINIEDRSTQGALYTSKYPNLYKDLVYSLVARFAKKSLGLYSKGVIEMLDIPLKQKIGGITHMDIGSMCLFKNVELIRRCAATLQVCKIHGHSTQDEFSGLFVDAATGEYVVYPNLRYLKAELKMDKGPDEPYPAFPDAVPFPNLQALKLLCEYPFSDNVVFRGNQHSLRSLRIYLSSEMVAQLLEDRTFTADNSNYTNLEKVELSTSGVRTNTDGNNKLKLMVNIARHAKVLCFRGYIADDQTREMFISQLGSLHATIQVLHIYDAGFSLCDAVNLLTRLPNLVELKLGDLSGFGCYDDEEEAPADYFNEVVKTNPSLGPQLRKLYLDNGGREWAIEQVQSVAMLAILCQDIRLIKLNTTKTLARVFVTMWNQISEEYESSKLESIPIIYN